MLWKARYENDNYDPRLTSLNKHPRQVIHNIEAADRKAAWKAAISLVDKLNAEKCKGWDNGWKLASFPVPEKGNFIPGF